MKKIFLAMAVLAAAVGCSKEDVISVDRQKIAFDTPFVENATRATDNTYGTVNKLTAFNVYGTVTGTAGTVNIFAGDKVTGTVGDAVWSCSNNQYWIPGADYSFAAVVDANAVATDGNGMPTTLTYNTADQKDLLYATAAVEDAVATQAPVEFTFNHLLSKAQFTVTSTTIATTDADANGYLDGYYHSVTGISVSNFETGTYTINGGTWAGATAKNIEFGNVEEVTAADTNGKTNATQMLLVPNTATFNVTFTVDLYKNGTKLGTETKTIAVDNNLVKGYAYNFKIACSVGNPIQFKVTQDPTWAEQTDVTVQ